MFVDYLGGLEKFPYLSKEFSNSTDLNVKGKIELLLQKGVYPYEYMNNWDKFAELSLPSKECFKNSLKKLRNYSRRICTCDESLE